MKDDAVRHQRLRAMFDEALRKDLADRQSYLHAVSIADPALRSELQRLLDAHERATSFLERPVALSGRSPGGDDFCGTSRFKVLRRLGAGGMGVVYEVQDLARDEVVALKTLRRTTPVGVYRLKQEFRSLAGVTHPNLVCLYELVVEDACCFFTMERVRGVSFVDHVREHDGASLSLDRLTSALRQLVDGVSALHRAGKLHRDIKPSNVLVTAEGRVVILDFGLITELFPGSLGGAEQVIGGTPAYVAPEAGFGAAPSEAGDWYSVGATLYEALTGQLPFSGSLIEVLLRKREVDPPSPMALAPDVPAELSSICMEMMCRDPSRRLSGPGAVRRLGCASAASPESEVRASVTDGPFVGRSRELEILNEAYRAVISGRAASVSVSGPSGIGKSALVGSFVTRVLARDDAIVFAGRCYEHESIPYKALDGVIDSLSRYLVSLPEPELLSVLPRGIAAVPRLFPVMLRVPAIAAASRRPDAASAEPSALRRIAFEALRELLARIADRRRVIIAIDDLQWADIDGALLLEELLRPPEAPCLLTVVSFRSEEVAGKAFLRRLLEGGGRNEWVSLPIPPMAEAEAAELVGALLPPDSPLSDSQKVRITREAAGSPFVLEQLARYAGVARLEPARAPTLAEMFETRLGTLLPDARRFVETLAIGGRPMAPELVFAACGIAGEGRSLVTMLRASRLIRSSGSSERVETYHDRIREVLAAKIEPDASRRIHARMVQALVERQSDDFEALFEHYDGAGDPENASIQAGLAAVKAAGALAFDRAAFYYRRALALSPGSADSPARREGLAHALAHAGRPAEAAEAYLLAGLDAGQQERTELQRRGAEQFLIGGHIDRGLDLIRTMLADMGVRSPRGPGAALLSASWGRARLLRRGLRFVARRADEIDPDLLRRVDTCWSATTGLLLVDMISAADFSVRHLLMALDAGDPFRIVRAMAIEAVAWHAYPTGRRFRDRLVQQARILANSVGSPHAIALSRLTDGLIAMNAGQWTRGSISSEEALAILRDQCVGLTWELNIAQNLVIWALMYRGELREVSRRVPPLLDDARRSGNLYIATELSTRSNYVWLAADDPDGGEREVVQSIERWSQKGFHRQHYSAMLALVQTALYCGDAERSWRLLAERKTWLRRSLITRVQVLRVESLYMWGRSALAMAAAGGDARRFLAVARSASRRIAGERRPWSDPIAVLLQAGIADLEGRRALAVQHLHEAAGLFDRADMKLYAAVARRRIGALQDDGPSRALQREAEDWMAAQEIRNPTAMTRMLAPGFRGVA